METDEYPFGEKLALVAAVASGKLPSVVLTVDSLPRAMSRHRDISADGMRQIVQNRFGPRHATRFNSDAAIVLAETKAWSTGDALASRNLTMKWNESRPRQHRLYFADVEFRAAQLLGRDWADFVEGWSRSPSGPTPTVFPSDTTIIVQWRRSSSEEWDLHTCFPNPEPYGGTSSNAIAELVYRVLRGHALVDTEFVELGSLLNQYQPPAWRAHFRDQLATALADNLMDIEVAHEIMGRRFEDTVALGEWFRQAWAAWFPLDAYPVVGD